MTEKPVLVYKVTHEPTGRVYVGITAMAISKRWYAHVRAGLTGNLTTPLHALIREVGSEEFRVEKIAEATTRREAGEMEKEFIAAFNCVSPTGFNRTHGGEPHSRWSDEARAKAAASRTGKTWTPEIREKLAAIMQTEEYRAKMRAAAAKGVAARAAKPLTDADRARISASAKKCQNRPEVRAARSARAKAKMQNPEARKNLSLKVSALWQDPDYRARSAASMKIVQSRPEYIAERRAFATKQMADPEMRRFLSETSKALHQDPAYRARYDAGRDKIRKRNSKSVYSPTYSEGKT